MTSDDRYDTTPFDLFLLKMRRLAMRIDFDTKPPTTAHGDDTRPVGDDGFFTQSLILRLARVAGRQCLAF